MHDAETERSEFFPWKLPSSACYERELRTPRVFRGRSVKNFKKNESGRTALGIAAAPHYETRVPFATAIEQLPPEVQGAAALFSLVMLALLPVAFVVFWRLLRRVESHGPLTRPDLFKLPDILAISVVFTMIALLIITSKMKQVAEPPKKAAATQASAPPEAPAKAGPLEKSDAPKPEPPLSAEQLISGIISLLLPALGLVIVFAMRGGSIRDLFGLDRVPFFKAVGTGLGLAALALPLTTFVKILVVAFTGSTEDPQKLVQEFNSANREGDWQISALIAASAVIVAPISEEIMFRGSFYPLFTRILGRVPSALFISVVFALLHDTYTDIPGLTMLSLCFVLAYEATGSLLVPMFMHAGFNGISVLIMAFGPQLPAT